MCVRVRSAMVLACVILMLGPPPPSAAADDPAAALSPVPTGTARITVTILGSVGSPGIRTFDVGARLSDALAAAGLAAVDAVNARAGIPPDARGCTFGGADRHRVFLLRSAESPNPATYAIDVALARQRNDLRYDPLLRENDKIYVPECRPFRIPIVVPLPHQDTAADVRNARRSAGGLAQLVEHLHGMQGVRSSSLLSSTT